MALLEVPPGDSEVGRKESLNTGPRGLPEDVALMLGGVQVEVLLSHRISLRSQ